MASSSSSSSSDDDEFEQLQAARDEYYKSRAAVLRKSTLVETKLDQISLPDHIRTGDKTIDFVIACLCEWITPRTKDYLEDKATTSTTAPVDPRRYEQLVKKIELQDMVDTNGPRAESKLPSIEQLKKKRAESQYELKVKEYLGGKSAMNTEVCH